MRTFTAADLASSDSETSDDTVVMTCGVSKQGYRFFFDKWVSKDAEPTEILREVIRQMIHYKSSRGFIEKNRFESIMRTCRKLVQRGFYGDPAQIGRVIRRISMVPHYGREGKQNRIVDGISQELKAHMLYFRGGEDWNDVRNQILMYPAVSFDDILDTIEMLISKSYGPSVDVVNQHSPAEDVYSRPDNKPLTINEVLAQKRYNVWTGGFVNNGSKRREACSYGRITK